MKMYQAKLKREVGQAAAPGFPQIGGPHYLLYMGDLHRKGDLSAYFEIGTETGASLMMATCASVAVDPEFKLQEDVSRNKPQLHQYRMTSDDFFTGGYLGRLGLTFDLAFLDGMHLYEYLLRDFMGIERHMSPGGTVLMHDCVPWNHLVADREWNRRATSSWTGDVWKLIPILRRHRPDLTVRVLDLAPSGLVEITGLDPANRDLDAAYDAIRAEWDAVTLEGYGLDRFREDVALVPAPGGAATALATPLPSRRIVASWEEPHTPADRAISIALKTSVPNPGRNDRWGDYHFARGLADAFLRQGHRVRIDSQAEWASDTDGTGIDLVLYGSAPYTPRAGVPCVAWVLYPGAPGSDGDLPLAGLQHVFFASGPATASFAGAHPGTPTSTLMQAFDPGRMHPARTAGNGIVFVGKNHFAAQGGRPVVDMAIASAVPFRLWGTGWRGHPAAANLQARILDNDQLGDVYRGARIVLCDHMPSMRQGGYVSNRIYDALACGAAVISDQVAGLPDDLAPFVHLVGTADEFRAAVDDILAETPERRADRLAFAATMAADHSFDARARAILSQIKTLA